MIDEQNEQDDLWRKFELDLLILWSGMPNQTYEAEQFTDGTNKIGQHIVFAVAVHDYDWDEFSDQLKGVQQNA